MEKTFLLNYESRYSRLYHPERFEGWDVCVHGWRYQHHQQYMPKEILEKFAAPSILKGTL